MRYYFAPMEGLTDSIYRRLHFECFGGVDTYVMPFYSPSVHRKLTGKEQRELPPAGKVPAIPQLLTKDTADFHWAARLCQDLGYSSVDLNLGCPSGTVVSKGKGSGMLGDPDHLDAFLDRIFTLSPIPISIKTRLGLRDMEEFPEIMDVYNRYPIQLLTVHPRLRVDFYKHPVRMEGFAYALAHSKNPLCYNGNLNSLTDIEAFTRQFPQVDALMLGRGLIGDPGMLTGSTAGQVRDFHDRLLEEYTETFGSARNAMFRLKENWRYLLHHFENSEKLGKKLRKATDLQDYRSITREIFDTLPYLPQLDPDW